MDRRKRVQNILEKDLKNSEIKTKEDLKILSGDLFKIYMVVNLNIEIKKSNNLIMCSFCLFLIIF